MQSSADPSAQVLAPQQLGVAVEGGISIMIHGFRLLLEQRDVFKQYASGSSYAKFFASSAGAQPQVQVRGHLCRAVLKTCRKLPPRRNVNPCPVLFVVYDEYID